MRANSCSCWRRTPSRADGVTRSAGLYVGPTMATLVPWPWPGSGDERNAASTSVARPTADQAILHHVHLDRDGATYLQPRGAGFSLAHLPRPQQSGGMGSQVSHLVADTPPEMQLTGVRAGSGSDHHLGVMPGQRRRKRRDSNPRYLSARSLSRSSTHRSVVTAPAV